jgi:Do/DeqQ family serine protease
MSMEDGAVRRSGGGWRIMMVRILSSCNFLLLASLACGGLAAQPLTSLAPMIERVAPAVVNISVSGHIASPLIEDPLFQRFFDTPEQRDFESAGSGVIVDAQQGYILTNYHVVENADRITITLLDNRVMAARVVGSDSASDLAVLQVEATGLTEMLFGESNTLRVGDFVVAIGNPFGFSHTVTSGIVSGLGRNRVNPDPNAYEDFIQTDASINPGNSGGALVNLDGNLVGINSAIISRTGGNIGIGFAIPVSMARNVMEQLVMFGEVSRGLLGVHISSITSDIATTFELPDATGALITDVNPGSAAEAAGLQSADIIVSIDDQPVRDSGSLRAMIGLLRPGDRVTIGFIRDGQRRLVTATLHTVDEPAARAAPAIAPELDPVFAGAELAPNRTGNGIDGLLVVHVDPGSRAGERGLRDGDMITHINRQRMRSLDEARQITANARTVIVGVQRGGRSLLILLRP